MGYCVTQFWFQKSWDSVKQTKFNKVHLTGVAQMRVDLHANRKSSRDFQVATNSTISGSKFIVTNKPIEMGKVEA